MPERSTYTRREDLTYKANRDNGRHGWLRLTPAYSMKLVTERLAVLPKGSMVLEPFSGSGTTPLVAQELDLRCEAREINPFLVWFGRTKLDEYSARDLDTVRTATESICADASNAYGSIFWKPPIFQIEKWWNQPTLAALSALRHFIDKVDGKPRNLLDVAFCRTMISTSAAAFNHQSMSFKNVAACDASNERADYEKVIRIFQNDAEYVVETANTPMEGHSTIENGDSTQPFDGFKQADILITSPPYANRMSYIRELRPYMYWLRFLSDGAQAGELDWKTTGGTWGSASTKLKTWEPDKDTPIETELNDVCGRILAGKSGKILSPYVFKYFHDIWDHLNAITPIMKKGGEVCYIVGNSTFSGNEVPTHRWYAEMLEALGYDDVHVDVIRKRNSNKKLFEFAVCGTKA